MALSPQEEKDFKDGSRVSAAGSRVTRVCGAFRDDLPGFSARSTLTKLEVVEHLEDPLESSKAAAIRAEVAISSAAQVVQGEICGHKTAACLPHESRTTGLKSRVLVGILLIL